ncbi:hypothetical protein TVAG_295590 [Trichomonas vaginalis G3]|uniref:Uncharacterized protein n=1 Tax=Trichomonas vaginalis (strain ATCC PRA-98 / G3) TaxID=412133 RepID=A2F226_TRIV3|nr:hypothetical protein TVAGG3_0971510 [Trichomonas vaginalis G3]EAY01025.1 hypothetical protein TVAG_295590 [Trichomonas vaginalis G3]KAI5488620.1 hypothetical protein TVAGG3_0971510 [Trichomonas vaginalis G3]|eukprot:XP_001313911.1 hypothetical protein [Trichomonas vaginalis G3]
MGNIIAAAKKNDITIPPPDNQQEVQTKIINAADKPSDGLKEIWLNAKSGYFDKSWLVYIEEPFTYAHFEKDSEGDGFRNFSEFEGLKAYAVCTLWSDTDSRIKIYEMLEGKEKGNLIAFPFSALDIYYSHKTCQEFLKVIETTAKWQDQGDDTDAIFDNFFEAPKKKAQ